MHENLIQFGIAAAVMVVVIGVVKLLNRFDELVRREKLLVVMKKVFTLYQWWLDQSNQATTSDSPSAEEKCLVELTIRVSAFLRETDLDTIDKIEKGLEDCVSDLEQIISTQTLPTGSVIKFEFYD